MKQHKQKSETKTGVIYCRVSSKEQVDGTSLESQERMCLEYAERGGIKVLGTFIERGESAKTANRTEFNKALNFCANKKHKVDYFIVYKIDRFARNQDDHVTVRALLRRAGTDLRSVTEPIDESPMGRALEGMMSVFAELDNNMRTERTQQGMLERIKQGVWVWSAPLGYMRTHKGSNIVPDPKISHLIRELFEEYSKHTHTYRSLADFITQRGLRTRCNKEMTPQFVEKIIKNKIYCGVISTWGEYEGSFEPIVSRALFAQCQVGYEGSVHAKPRSANNPLFPLRKVIVCSVCKTPLTGSVSKGRNKKYAYYHHGHQRCEKSQSIPKDDFEQSFVEYLGGITPDKKYEKLFKAIVLDIWKQNYKSLDEENVRIRREITKLESERQKVFDLHRKGVYTEDEFIEQKKLINDQINQKHSLIQEKQDEGFVMEQALEHCFQFVRNTTKTWIEATYHEKLQFQKRIFKNQVEFDGKIFGTVELSQVYKINQAYQSDKSSLVIPRGVEPRFTG